MSQESPAEWYRYAVVRVVPRVEREEFVNVGIVLFARTSRILSTRIELDENRILNLDPQADIEDIRQHLATFEAICEGDPGGGPIAELPIDERFHWLTAPRSTIIQVSPVHEGRATDFEATLVRLFEEYVPIPGS